jgi:hypothetical protein
VGVWAVEVLGDVKAFVDSGEGGAELVRCLVRRSGLSSGDG